MKFETVKQTVQQCHISENLLRRMIKQGTAPGYFSGTRFYVNVDKLMAMLDNSTAATAQEVEAG